MKTIMKFESLLPFALMILSLPFFMVYLLLAAMYILAKKPFQSGIGDADEGFVDRGDSNT